MSVRLSVRHTHDSRLYMEILFAPYYSDVSSFFFAPNFVLPNLELSQEPPPAPQHRQSDQYSAISWKRCETECKLLLFTNRNFMKSQTGFPLVRKSVLLNDLKRRNGSFSVLSHRNR